MTFSSEQEELRSTVRKILEGEADPWPALCHVGVPALAIPERHGGLGAGLTEVQIVAEELGRVLANVPFMGSQLAIAALLSTDDKTLLPRLAEGAIGALGWIEAEGIAPYVIDGDRAEILLVTDGLSLCEVDNATVRYTPAMDETRRLATVEFSAARRIGALGPVRDFACAVLAAEQAGAAARALEITVGYCKQRYQFGRPIGGFQALKHRMADLYVLVETARSAAYAATSERLAAVAKAYCSEAFSTVAAEMIQLHGGIAITWEHPAHRYFKRAHASSQLFGPPQAHLARIGVGPAPS